MIPMQEMKVLRPVLAGMLVLSLAATVHAHHSFSGYDQKRVLVITGVVRSFKPHANHVEFVISPLNAAHTGLAQDEAGNNLNWQVELEYGAALAARNEGITTSTFKPGAVVSVALHPMVNGDRKGTRTGAIYRCPDQKLPKPGQHCDSVDGHIVHGNGPLKAPTEP